MAGGSADDDRKSNLMGTISLSGAITTDPGTMIGAEIFVYPIGPTGIGTTVSFTTGAIVAPCLASHSPTGDRNAREGRRVLLRV
jgi:hypothetical protein